MKNILFLFLFSASSIFAQDTIFTKGGRIFAGKVYWPYKVSTMFDLPTGQIEISNDSIRRIIVTSSIEHAEKYIRWGIPCNSSVRSEVIVDQKTYMNRAGYSLKAFGNYTYTGIALTCTGTIMMGIGFGTEVNDGLGYAGIGVAIVGTIFTLIAPSKAIRAGNFLISASQ